jgi:branched-chain amino acid aminotransferase
VHPLGHPINARDQGITAIIAESRRNELSASAGHKTTGFVDAILELARARENGAGECIFLDTQGHVSEGSTSNIFLYDGETLLTPALACGALPGITRSAVLELARRMSVPCEERAIEKEELFLAGEAFFTSSVVEIVPLVRVNEFTIGAGRPGELTKALISGYGSLVAAESGE